MAGAHGRSDKCAALLQSAISLGYLTPQHIAYQSLYRLCLKAFGIDDEEKPEFWGPLRRFSGTMYHIRPEALEMLRGRGMSGLGVSKLHPRDYFLSHNSGVFSARHLCRLQSTFSLEAGRFDIYNLSTIFALIGSRPVQLCILHCI